MLTESLSAYWTPKPVVTRALPYVRRSELELFGLLRNVSQYAPAKFRLADVEVSDRVLVLQEAVKEFKVLQIKQHMQDLRVHGCDFFKVQHDGNSRFSIAWRQA